MAAFLPHRSLRSVPVHNLRWYSLPRLGCAFLVDGTACLLSVVVPGFFSPPRTVFILNRDRVERGFVLLSSRAARIVRIRSDSAFLEVLCRRSSGRRPAASTRVGSRRHGRAELGYGPGGGGSGGGGGGRSGGDPRNVAAAPATRGGHAPRVAAAATGRCARAARRGGGDRQPGGELVAFKGGELWQWGGGPARSAAAAGGREGMRQRQATRHNDRGEAARAEGGGHIDARGSRGDM